MDTLRQAKSTNAEESSGGAPAGQVGVDEACEGQVRAEVVDHIRQAVNQARDAAGAGDSPPPVDLDLLAEQLCRVQEESLLGMARIGRNLDAVLERLRQAGR